MADYIKSKGIAGIKMSQEVNKESYEKSIQRLKRELEEISSKVNSAKELLINEETKTEEVRKEHKLKKEELVRFKSEERSLALLIQSNQKKIEEQALTYSTEKQKLEMELIKIQESIANCEKEIKDLDESISGKRDYLHTLERDVTSLEDLYLENIENVNALNQDIGNLTIALKEAENTISYARIIEIGLEKREATLSKKEGICEVRRRSLERMFERKLGINIKHKFYGKNI
jgi:chromosome segregation ATPase